MLACVFFCCLLCSAFSADILAVFPHTGKSHYDVFQPLLLTLAARGHRLTVLSFFPQKTPVVNLTDISLVGIAPVFVNAVKVQEVLDLNPLLDFMWVTQLGLDACEDVMHSKQMENLLKSGKTFDLLIVELFNTDCFFALSRFFSAPYIAASSSNRLPHHMPRIGNPDSLAFSSNLFLPMSYRMSFLERVVNVLSTVIMRLGRSFRCSGRQKTVVGEVLGPQMDLDRIIRDVSLVLYNSHHSVQGVRPLVPAFVEVGGLHVPPVKPLPKDLDKYLNDSADGALLFSMGSVLQSSSFPADKRQSIMDAFAELPVRILMKWEDDTLPGKPDNVRLSKWLPQRDILAHPKIRGFMGHGGLLSSSEAVYCGVPMVLIPMFGDQPNNVAHLEASGAAVKLPYQEITKKTVLRALRSILYDSSYREKAKDLSERFRDRPMSPLDTAVYWTEYVLRHKGAPHLRSPAVDMPWYQLWLLDVVAVLLAALVVLLLVFVWMYKRISALISFLFSSGTSKSKRD